MLVVLTPEALEDRAADPLDVLELFGACAERRHVLILLPKVGRAALDAWMDAHLADRSPLRRRLDQILSDGLRKYTNLLGDVVRVTVVPGPSTWSDARVTAAHAVRLLQRPLADLGPT